VAEEINPWIKRAVTLATFICTLLFAQQAAQITWLIIEDHSIILPAPAQNNKQSQQQTENYTIEQYHLFGTASEKPVETKTVTNVDAPTTKLRLELKGVFTAETQATSSAIIAEKGRGGDYFKVGEKVQGRTKLAAVYPDKVILDTNGKMETLEFEESKGVGIKANKSTESKRNKNNERSKKAQKRLSKSRNPQDFVNLAKDLLNSDAKGAVSSMGLEPVAKDSSSGYRVGSSATMLLSIGMKVGDIILSVNDQPVGNIAQDQMLLDEVTSSGNAKVEIQRGSRRLVINHSL
jgi:general secretion pathway protein C